MNLFIKRFYSKMEIELQRLALKVGVYLKSNGWRLVTAESCTGGWVAKVVTDIAGSSNWFERGFVTYTNASKMDMLGVSSITLDTWGAVSEQTVREMAQGGLRRSRGNLSVAISGIAGPAGGTVEKPVGTVWFAWAHLGCETNAVHKRFTGDRDAIRHQAVVTALEGLFEFE